MPKSASALKQTEKIGVGVIGYGHLALGSHTTALNLFGGIRVDRRFQSSRARGSIGAACGAWMCGHLRDGTDHARAPRRVTSGLERLRMEEARSLSRDRADGLGTVARPGLRWPASHIH